MPKVFISYSHDSPEHSANVLALSNWLNNSGVDCDIDQYINGSPEEGWALWMEQMLTEASHVLIICTETYLNRVQRKEKPGTGKGVKWESLLTYQDIYDNDSLNKKFIPIIFASTNIKFIPKPLRSVSSYDLSRAETYEKLLRVLTEQPRAVKPTPRQTPHLPPINLGITMSSTIHIDRLPTVSGAFFGREAELQLLDDALSGNGTRIIQFIAAGGTGKTKLLRHWLNQHDTDIPNRLVWSFYSQGAAEDKQVSASPFFLDAFKALKAEKSSFNSEEEKGDYLAELLISHQCLLVLDGLEPLQHAGRGMRGELKDRAIRQLLKNLASKHTSLCIITSQIAVFELSDRDHVVTHDLHNLTQSDGVALLRSLKVKGHHQSLGKAVREYGCHALTLHLLGNALHTYLDGDVRKRDTILKLIGDDDHLERHAFKVMLAYSKWLADTPELKLLHLLGLFDHPIETDVLQVLWRQQIPDLTQGIAETAWKVAIRDLRDKHKLLFAHNPKADLLDCHPLIREYFGRQLRETYPHAWQQAHASLYNHYQALPEKTQPDTLEQMQPLFHAIGHGCAAGLHQHVFDKLYWHRVSREKGYYLNKIGAAGDNLAALIHFFDKPWVIPSPNLDMQTQAQLLRIAGYNLRALGRLDESIEPFSTALHLYENTK
ncbi:AAA ATPase domain-containing protein [Thiothrix caldifontis]|uniref:AAA ATPase domain-containing protein n=1 Tax=Thiothrix caldifontis TaxID=525918 RepID=A0A1H4F4S5_9GAMM|nr:SEFIR domain-containing protein [Thiothrix caldifontis]SEA91788.1 AAA ATPase domain-containing protein [Thiothrix caldifontis]